MNAVTRFVLAAVVALGSSLSLAAAEPPAEPAAPDPEILAEAKALADNSVPSWIDQEQFERQLMLVHGKLPDPETGLFGPQSQMWRLSRYFTPGALGSGRALILQISHPWVTAGIDEHSITRNDPLKRGRDTFRYILTMTYGTRDQALQAARDVRTIHEKVRGHMAYRAGNFQEGSEYRANEEKAMLWVHATLWETLVITYEQSIEKMSDSDKEKFYQETKLFAYLFGIRDEALPQDWKAFVAYCEEMRSNGNLEATHASKELASYLFGWHGFMLYFPLKYAKLAAAANLPEDLREQYGLRYGFFGSRFYRSTLWMSRVGHRFTPGFVTKNPVHKEAVARLQHRKASWWTRTQIKLALGQKSLVNDYQ